MSKDTMIAIGKIEKDNKSHFMKFNGRVKSRVVSKIILNAKNTLNVGDSIVAVKMLNISDGIMEAEILKIKYLA